MVVVIDGDKNGFIYLLLSNWLFLNLVVDVGGVFRLGFLWIIWMSEGNDEKGGFMVVVCVMGLDVVFECRFIGSCCFFCDGWVFFWGGFWEFWFF